MKLESFSLRPKDGSTRAAGQKQRPCSPVLSRPTLTTGTQMLT